MLRKLQLEDAARMYEWMHDEEVIKNLNAELFRGKTLSDCERFIKLSQNEKKNCHMAIVDNDNLYRGTVSLKNIDYNHKDAEFAIVLKRDSWGCGYACKAMKEIMKIAFESYHLNEVYWNVLKKNVSAIRLYEKGGYKKINYIEERILDSIPSNLKTEDLDKFIFYHETKENYYETI